VRLWLVTCQRVSARQCCVDDGSFQWERPIFEGPRLKTFDQSIPNYEQITIVLISWYKPTFITFASKGSSAQYGEVAIFLFDRFFSTSCRDPPPERAGRISLLILQATSFATRKCLFGVSSMEKNFRRDTPSTNFSKGILHANRKSRITFIAFFKTATPFKNSVVIGQKSPL
jgi:hypothetical protein